MVKLNYEVFASIIESIRLQMQKDIECAEKISETFGIDVCYVPAYDNSLLIKSLIAILHLQFPKDGSFSEIEHYMFELNFGKNGEDFVSVEDLWNQLNKEPIVSTHPLIDDQKVEYNRYFVMKDQ
jgi:hypothetical protein